MKIEVLKYLGSIDENSIGSYAKSFNALNFGVLKNSKGVFKNQVVFVNRNDIGYFEENLVSNYYYELIVKNMLIELPNKVMQVLILLDVNKVDYDDSFRLTTKDIVMISREKILYRKEK